MYKEDFDITEVKSRAGLREESLCSQRKVAGLLFFAWWVNHYSQDVNVTEHGGLLCQFPSVPLWEKQRVQSVTFFFYSLHLKVIYNWPVVVWKQRKTKKRQQRNTFCVISEPHLLVVITKAYVPGFLHPYNIHNHLVLYIHTCESVPGRVTLYKTYLAAAVQYIFTTLENASRLIKQAKMCGWKWK